MINECVACGQEKLARDCVRKGFAICKECIRNGETFEKWENHFLEFDAANRSGATLPPAPSLEKGKKTKKRNT